MGVGVDESSTARAIHSSSLNLELVGEEHFPVTLESDCFPTGEGIAPVTAPFATANWS